MSKTVAQSKSVTLSPNTHFVSKVFQAKASGATIYLLPYVPFKFLVTSSFTMEMVNAE